MTAVLSIKNVTKGYPDFTLKPITVNAEPGKIIGLLGRNGAGKSTLIKCIVGLLHPDSGSIEISGRSFAHDEVAQRQMIGFVPDSQPMYDWMQIQKFLNFVATFYPNWDHNYCQKLLQKFTLDPAKKIRDLSHGMRVKVALTMALSFHAPLLVLDEPTSGLDPVVRAEFLNELRSEIEGSTIPRSVIISSHVLEDIALVADEVVLIRQGEMVVHSTLQELAAGWELLSIQSDTGTTSLQSIVMGHKVVPLRDGRTHILCPLPHVSEIKGHFVSNGFHNIEIRKPTLQETFLALG